MCVVTEKHYLGRIVGSVVFLLLSGYSKSQFARVCLCVFGVSLFFFN